MKATYTRRNMTTQDIDAIILSDTYGMTQQEIANRTGFSLRAVWVVLQANQAIKSKDWPRCIELIWKNRAAYKTFSWLAERNNIQLPPEVREEYEKMIAAVHSGAKKSKPEDKPEQEEDIKPETQPQMSNEERFFLAVLRHLAIQTKLLAEQNKLITEQNEMLKRL